MTIKEMQACAAQTLFKFIDVMPDCPFTADDIDIVFATRKNSVEIYKTLCRQCSPNRQLTDNHCYQLETLTAANAIIGREKSAAVVKINYKLNENDLQVIIFHELMHIYCGKIEMDTEHFIDVYGSGHTPDPDPTDKEYDGYLNAGYKAWSEFIAHYYAMKMMSHEKYSFAAIIETVFRLLGDIVRANVDGNASFAMLCAYFFTCTDVNQAMKDISKPDCIFDDAAPYGEQTRMALKNCLEHIYNHIQSERPWKITEDFIYELGEYLVFLKVMNSLYLGVLADDPRSEE